jgi:hypothetical protein
LWINRQREQRKNTPCDGLCVDLTNAVECQGTRLLPGGLGGERIGGEEKMMSRFLFGFVIGVLIGAATVIFAAPRSGAQTLRGVRGLLDESIAVGKRASAASEQELWAQFRTRRAQKEG